MYSRPVIRILRSLHTARCVTDDRCRPGLRWDQLFSTTVRTAVRAAQAADPATVSSAAVAALVARALADPVSDYPSP